MFLNSSEFWAAFSGICCSRCSFCDTPSSGYSFCSGHGIRPEGDRASLYSWPLEWAETLVGAPSAQFSQENPAQGLLVAGFNHAWFVHSIRIFAQIETSNQTPIVNGATQSGLQPLYLYVVLVDAINLLQNDSYGYPSITTSMNQQFTRARFQQRIVCVRLRCGNGHLASFG